MESAPCKDADAVVVENSQTGPPAGTVCSTVSETIKQPLEKDGETSNDKGSSCEGCTETNKCQPNQPTPKEPITSKESPKDPVSLSETNGQDGAPEVSEGLGADRQSAVDIGSNRSEGEFNKVNDLSDGALTAIEDSLRQIAVACFQDLKTDEDNVTRGQNGPPQFEAANTFDMCEYKH